MMNVTFMQYVRNPFGRIVEVSDEKPIIRYDLKTGDPTKWGTSDYENWLAQPGFSKPTQEEIDEYVTKRTAQINSYKQSEQLSKEVYSKDGVYFVTVSQGGKDGYGVASAGIYNELQKLGVNISFGNDGQRVALLFHAPYSLSRLEAPIRILYTMFESDKLPDDWRDYLEMADKIIVPSKWNQKVFSDFGFPADVVPLGYDDNTWKFIERKPKKPERGTYTFLHYNAFNLRKGFPEVFKAFVKAFDPTEPVKMIFKTTLNHMPIPINPEQYPNIEIITGQISDEEMNGIMARSDCFVFPSRGEGFGMTPLEAMATGMPAIVPNAHGISEYFNENFMYEVKVKENCPAIYSRYKGQDVGKMVVCDVDDLARQMRWVYDHEDEALAKGRAASFYVKTFTFKETAKKLKAIIDEMLKKPEVTRPLKNILQLQTLK